MKILHLYSDWKWTGPAEPTVNLVKALMEKGLDVVFACRKPPPEAPRSIEKNAGRRGLNVTTEFHLNRYFNVFDNVRDLRNLPSFLRTNGFDLVHCHLSHDHAIGAWGAKCRAPFIPLVRTNHKCVPLKRNALNSRLMGRWTDGLVGFSQHAARVDSENFGISPERYCVLSTALDLSKFDPGKVQGDLRAQFGFSPGDVVVGIVARMQRHRRFHIFFEAIDYARKRIPSIRVLILGRGTHMQKVAVEPVQRLGLSDIVVFGGYRLGDYVDALACFDIKIFLVPGSDGTCRALREAMAMGKPAVTVNRGMLSEIVDHGRTGFVAGDTPEEIGEAIVRLASDRNLRQRMGETARREALMRFSPEAQAERLIRFYEQVLSNWGRDRA